MEGKPLLEPRQVAGTFTFDGGERLSELVIRKPFQFAVRHEPKANHEVRPEGFLNGGRVLENVEAGK